MTYQVPTTVFAPLELAAVGLTEERAAVQYGENCVQVCGMCTLSCCNNIPAITLHPQLHVYQHVCIFLIE